MVRRSYTAVVAKNEAWQGQAETEPYEAGWAGEAVIFVRFLEVEGDLTGAKAHIQISPDGIHWADEGTFFNLPREVDEVTFGRVTNFGNWLRIRADLPVAAICKVLVTIALKE